MLQNAEAIVIIGGVMNLNPAALQAIRKGRGLTVTAVADRSGLARTHISNIENGNRPATPAVIAALAQALDCGVYELLGPEDPKAAVREIVKLLRLTPEDMFPKEPLGIDQRVAS